MALLETAEELGEEEEEESQERCQALGGIEVIAFKTHMENCHIWR